VEAYFSVFPLRGDYWLGIGMKVIFENVYMHFLFAAKQHKRVVDRSPLSVIARISPDCVRMDVEVHCDPRLSTGHRIQCEDPRCMGMTTENRDCRASSRHDDAKLHRRL